MDDHPFARRVAAALADETFLGLVLSRPARKDAPPRHDVRRTVVKNAPTLQWTSRVGRQDHHRNLDDAASVAECARLLGPVYRDARLFTSTADWTARASRRGKLSIRQEPPTRQEAAPVSHDRPVQRLIPGGEPCAFLHAIGVMTAEGRVRSSKQAKFRQINRYLELVDDVLPSLPPTGTLQVVDYGCGKSYLTFALHHLLTHLRGRKVRILGLDHNPAVVATCQHVVAKLGLTDLHFQTGDIASHEPSGEVHLAVSLHACDTATDDALGRAVAWGARCILAVPCCQHELARLWSQPALAAVAEHGILGERFAALATDALRAAALEAAGYRTQVLEFVDLEHTPKNLMLRAIAGSDPARRRRFAEQYRATKTHLGLTAIHLDGVLPGLD